MAEHSRCNIMIVEDEEQLNKVENIQDMLPELQAIVQYTGFPRSEHAHCQAQARGQNSKCWTLKAPMYFYMLDFLTLFKAFKLN